MKDTHVYIFRLEKINVYIDLRCFIIYSVMQLVQKSFFSVVLNFITPLMYHHQGRNVLSNLWPPRSFVTLLFCSM